MGFFRCSKNTGIFHSKICTCTDNQEKVNRITMFFDKNTQNEYINDLKKIICTYEDFSTFQDEQEKKEYLDAKEQLKIIESLS